MRRDGFDGAGDIAQIGLVILVQRRGDADDDRVHRGDLRVVGRGAKAGLLRLANHFWQNANNVGAAGIERVNLVGCNIEAGDAKLLPAEQQRQGQPDISHPHNADAGLTRSDLALTSAAGPLATVAIPQS